VQDKSEYPNGQDARRQECTSTLSKILHDRVSVMLYTRLRGLSMSNNARGLPVVMHRGRLNQVLGLLGSEGSFKSSDEEGVYG
jgi:hypothetical protein